jgi:hypothetical protein
MDLHKKLKDAGYNPWIDKKDIDGGIKWEKAIKKSIKKCRFFIACISNNYGREDDWNYKEGEYALASWKSRRKIYIIPVKIEQCEYSKILHAFQHINLLEPDGFQRLIASLER